MPLKKKVQKGKPSAPKVCCAIRSNKVEKNEVVMCVLDVGNIKLMYQARRRVRFEGVHWNPPFDLKSFYTPLS